jgi:putative membrane protein
MIKILLRILITAGALLLIAHFVPGIAIASFVTAVWVALLWGIIGITIKPLLFLLTLPVNILTLGLFSFVVNALLFWLLALLVPHFSVSGFIPALEGSVILSLVSMVLHAAFKSSKE